ncbi:hypothetical protein EVAR_18691_1 [Eumeta japonica]|uniref:Uncharacterized protein n=1 Tax=Eumeta variegata TaxID=151549 RepID=A0A4C1U714_EUMVA|nr:hypothetical protein EVAR_18691_1 [Eumeta japonica]
MIIKSLYLTNFTTGVNQDLHTLGVNTLLYSAVAPLPNLNVAEHLSKMIFAQVTLHATIIDHDHRTWSRYLLVIRFALNKLFMHLPAELTFGRKMRDSMDVQDVIKVILDQNNFVPRSYLRKFALLSHKPKTNSKRGKIW